MVSAFLQRCLDDPIRSADRANKLWLPKGKKADLRRSEGEKDADNADSRVRRAANVEADMAKRAQLLDHYAKTEVPFSRVAKHVGMRRTDVIREMARRGRNT